MNKDCVLRMQGYGWLWQWFDGCVCSFYSNSSTPCESWCADLCRRSRVRSCRRSLSLRFTLATSSTRWWRRRWRTSTPSSGSVNSGASRRPPHDHGCIHYSSIIKLAGYPASLEFPIMHPLCIIKLCEELVAEVSLTIVTASRRIRGFAKLKNSKNSN